MRPRVFSEKIEAFLNTEDLPWSLPGNLKPVKCSAVN